MRTKLIDAQIRDPHRGPFDVQPTEGEFITMRLNKTRQDREPVNKRARTAAQDRRVSLAQKHHPANHAEYNHYVLNARPSAQVA